MGATSKYNLPWPAPTELLSTVAASIRSLAEAVEDAMRPPLIATSSTGEPDWTTSDKTGRVPWDVADAARRRGEWNGFGNDKLLRPEGSGWYVVSASFVYKGKATPDTYELQVQTKTPQQTQADAFTWITDRTEVPASADGSTSTIKTVCTVVRLNADEGVQIVVKYSGDTPPPATTPGANKLRIHKLSAL